MIITCEEKSHLAKAFEAVDAGPYNTIFYPNVDSCLSITYVLSGNHLVGGHAGYGKNMDPASNALRVVGKMNHMVQLAGKPIEMVIFVGNLPDYPLAALTPGGLGVTVRKVDVEKGQADIHVFSSRRWMTIQRKGQTIWQGSFESLPPIRMSV